jgi:hypothetical protein
MLEPVSEHLGPVKADPSLCWQIIKSRIGVVEAAVLLFVRGISTRALLLIYPMFRYNLLNGLSFLELSVLVSVCRRVAKMQIEEQKQQPETVETAAQADSDESKSKRGGKRPGAGRKPNLAKVLLKGVPAQRSSRPSRTSMSRQLSSAC